MRQVMRQDGMKTAWMKNRNADSVRSFAYKKGKYMKSKVEFYKAFFEELEKKGFGVAQPSSPDYVVDIQFKGTVIITAEIRCS